MSGGTHASKHSPQRCVEQKSRTVPGMDAVIKGAALPVQSLPWQYCLLRQ